MKVRAAPGWWLCTQRAGRGAQWRGALEVASTHAHAPAMCGKFTARWFAGRPAVPRPTRSVAEVWQTPVEYDWRRGRLPLSSAQQHEDDDDDDDYQGGPFYEVEDKEQQRQPAQEADERKLLDTMQPGRFWNLPRPPRVCVVHPYLRNVVYAGKRKQRLSLLGPREEEELLCGGQAYPDLRLKEAVALVEALNWPVDEAMCITVNSVNPSHFIGKGKVGELKKLCQSRTFDVVVVDTNLLTPAQAQKLANILGVRVMDRYRLILEIFAQRAQSEESRLQVELAGLAYKSVHLKSAMESKHLSQQRAGGAFLSGAGETNLEVERRLLVTREKKIKNRLEMLQKTRVLHRESRKKQDIPTIAILGYTNAGKSALLNRLAGTALVSQNQLFASLQTFMRRIELPSGCAVLAADTVGFISNLPHGLVAPFRSTLDEIKSADILLHVRDITNAESELQRANVCKVIKEIGIQIDQNTRQKYFEVWNKIDLIDRSQLQSLLATQRDSTQHIFPISARTGEGCNQLLTRIDETMQMLYPERRKVYEIFIGPEDQDKMAFLSHHGRVRSVLADSESSGLTRMNVEMWPGHYQRFCTQFGLDQVPSS